MSYATKEQLAELAAYMASQINVPTIGIGGGYAPIGTVISYMGTTAPQDYLACDGSTKNIADYPQLADFFEAQFGSKNYFGGDGTTTFAVPDLQGEFLRGSGTNSHTNQGSGANVGVHQDGTSIPSIQGTGSISLGKASVSDVDYQGSNIGRSFVSNMQTDEWGSIFTSRPTNTSVLYCIKAVNAGEIYSTDERVVGTWIDGKKIYRKILQTTMPTVETDGTYVTTTVAHGISGTKDLIFLNAMVHSYYQNGSLHYGYKANTAWGPADDVKYSVYTQYNGENILIGSNRSAMNNMKVFIILEYTKTTD